MVMALLRRWSEDEKLTEVIDIQAGRSRRGSEEAPER